MAKTVCWQFLFVFVVFVFFSFEQLYFPKIKKLVLDDTYMNIVIASLEPILLVQEQLS